MENPADYEVNFFLPAVFGLLVIIFFSAAGFLFRLLRKTGVIGFINRHYALTLVKDIFLSFCGVLFFSVILSLLIFVIEIIVTLFSK